METQRRAAFLLSNAALPRIDKPSAPPRQQREFRLPALERPLAARAVSFEAEVAELPRVQVVSTAEQQRELRRRRLSVMAGAACLVLAVIVVFLQRVL